MTKVLFAFEDTDESRRVLAAALEDASWADKKLRPTLELGFGLIEADALFILTKALQHGAKLLVVPYVIEKVVHAKPEEDVGARFGRGGISGAGSKGKVAAKEGK